LGALSALAAEEADAPVDAVCRIIDSSARAQNLPVEFLTRLIWRESNFRPDAKSPVGARGIAQFMPSTAAERGLSNPNDPEAAIGKAAEFLANLKQRFGNLGLAAAAYNAGSTRVAAWLQGAGDLAPETHDYVMILTRHPVEDWRGGGAASLTDDTVFPETSCVRSVASARRADPAAFANSAPFALFSDELSSGFAKGAAMWNASVSALASLPILNFTSAYVSPALVVSLIACAGLMYFLVAVVRGPIRAIRDELRRNNSQLEALLRSGATDSTNPGTAKPALVGDPGDLLGAERPAPIIDRHEGPGWLRLANFARRDRAGIERPSEPAGEAADAAEASGPAHPAAAPTEPAATDAAPVASFASGDQQKPGSSPPEIFPLLGAPDRQPAPQAKKASSRGRKLAFAGAALAFLLACGAISVVGSPLNGSLAGMRDGATAGLASAVDALKAPLGAITGPTHEEEARMRDLSAALEQATARLDKIERDYGARLDKLDERVDKDSSAGSADVASRLDKLEQKATAPAQPAAEFADLAARLDKLERRAALAVQLAPQIADLSSKLDTLEKNAALEKGEKKAEVSAASSAKPPPLTAKQSPPIARADPSASPDPSKPDSQRTALREYSVEDVRNGIAMVYSRHGLQPVAPGDFLPGAGRVLRIERRRGDWFVVTSLGVITRGQAVY
jgi:Transglycosylase SLT domain